MPESTQFPNVKITEDDGVSRIGAVNVGKYPLHHFAHEFDEETTRTLPLFLCFAGYDEWVKGCYRVRKSSNIFALEFVREGTFHFTNNGQSYEARPGSMFIVHKQSNTEMSTVSDYAAKQALGIDGMMLQPLLEQNGLTRCPFLTLKEPELFIRLFNKAHSLLSKRGNNYQLQCSILAYELLLQLGAAYQQSFPEPLNEIINYINRNLHQPLSLVDLSHMFGIGRTSLYRLFIAHLKKSVGDYIISRRLQAAENLLQTTDYPIKEIAARVGYSNQLYFATEFKRMTGETPSDYRKRLKFSLSHTFTNARKAETDGDRDE